MRIENYPIIPNSGGLMEGGTGFHFFTKEVEDVLREKERGVARALPEKHPVANVKQTDTPDDSADYICGVGGTA